MNHTATDFREIVRMAFRYSINLIPQESNDKDKQLYRFLQYTWNEQLPKFHMLYIKGGDIPAIEKGEDFRVGLFIASVGLMTYGHKDAIPFVLQNIPELGKIHHLPMIILRLLPLPENIQDLEEKKVILTWLEENYEALTWDKEKEVFYLKKEEADEV